MVGQGPPRAQDPPPEAGAEPREEEAGPGAEETPRHTVTSMVEDAQRTTYVLVDGENIDATLGTSILAGARSPTSGRAGTGC